jgi:hypothetical protein
MKLPEGVRGRRDASFIEDGTMMAIRFGAYSASPRWCLRAEERIFASMDLRFDRTDFAVVVKNRAPPPKAWRWEIYRAGRASPVDYSSVYFETMTAANKAGKEALKQLLTEFPD